MAGTDDGDSWQRSPSSIRSASRPETKEAGHGRRWTQTSFAEWTLESNFLCRMAAKRLFRRPYRPKRMTSCFRASILHQKLLSPPKREPPGGASGGTLPKRGSSNEIVTVAKRSYRPQAGCHRHYEGQPAPSGTFPTLRRVSPTPSEGRRVGRPQTRTRACSRTNGNRIVCIRPFCEGLGDAAGTARHRLHWCGTKHRKKGTP